MEKSVRPLAICSQGTVEGVERPAERSRGTLHNSRFTGVELFVTEGEEGHLGGKTAEPSISSSEATGSTRSIVMPDPEFVRGLGDRFDWPTLCILSIDLRDFSNRLQRQRHIDEH